MRWTLGALSLVCSLIGSYAQTITATDAAGDLVLEYTTLNPVFLTPETIIVSTISTFGVDAASSSSVPDAASSTSITTNPTSATTSDSGPGPVQSPGSAPTGITAITYTYTTTDADGDNTAIVAVFTPTQPATQPPPTLPSGTVWDYSSWLSLVGTNTAQANVINSTSGAMTWRLGGHAVAAGATVFAGALAGALVVL